MWSQWRWLDLVWLFLNLVISRIFTHYSVKKTKQNQLCGGKHLSGKRSDRKGLTGWSWSTDYSHSDNHSLPLCWAEKPQNTQQIEPWGGWTTKPHQVPLLSAESREKCCLFWWMWIFCWGCRCWGQYLTQDPGWIQPALCPRSRLMVMVYCFLGTLWIPQYKHIMVIATAYLSFVGDHVKGFYGPNFLYSP